jgi:hypothetical protein
MMSNRLLRTLTLLAFTAFSTVALADDPPARVGRVALAQGQVSISSNVGAPWANVQVNWPVTSQNTITTAPGARTELRIGSTSVRLDGGSALEVSDLDDDYLHLRLHYGSVSVRVVNTDVLGGFELATPQARVRMLRPGRIRVDAERAPDTSMVQVFDGEARVEGGGTELVVRAGRRAEVGDDDVRTAVATRDPFDDWSAGRDQYEDRSLATRYVAPEMTGYEDLDRYGTWSTDSEYGSLWQPSVAPDWVPYRDGSWTWIDPWGWTWVDNAPWGYAPFHYGRWVHVHNRWAWAPGRHDRHPVWAPALVGWVGGPGLNLTFRGHNGPAQGWFPLSPHDRFDPWYRAPEAHLRWWNRNVRPDQRRDHDRGHRPDGLTMVPHGAFGNRNRVDVPSVPHGALAQGAFKPGSAPPAPPMAGDRDRRFDRGHGDRDRFDRGQRSPVLTAPPVLSNQPGSPGNITSPPPGPQFQPGPFPRGRDGREVFEDGRRHQPLRTTPPPLGTAIASPPNQGPAPGTVIASPPNQHFPVPGTVIASPPNQSGPPAGTAIGAQPLHADPFPQSGFARPDRPHRGDGEFEHHRGRDQRAMQPQAIAAPAPQPQPMAPPPVARPPMAAQPMPAPAGAAMPRPMPAAAPPAAAAAAQPAPPQRGEDRRQGGDDRRQGGRDRGARQMER